MAAYRYRSDLAPELRAEGEVRGEVKAVLQEIVAEHAVGCPFAIDERLRVAR
jgi:hypothetical protein